jgi:hypothetical protein
MTTQIPITPTTQTKDNNSPQGQGESMSRMSDKWIALSEQAAEDTRQLRERQSTEIVDLLTQQTEEINALRAKITGLTDALRAERERDQGGQI